MGPGILGKKIGMTQVFREDGQVVPVTVLKAGPCVVVQRKTPTTDGYDAVQLGFVEFAKTRRAVKPMRSRSSNRQACTLSCVSPAPSQSPTPRAS